MREHAEDLFATGDQVAGDPFAAERPLSGLRLGLQLRGSARDFVPR
jgi:hypothetical protein